MITPHMASRRFNYPFSVCRLQFSRSSFDCNFPAALPPIEREKKIAATPTFFDMGLRAGGPICAIGVNLANLCHRVENCPLTRVSVPTSTAQEDKC